MEENNNCNDEEDMEDSLEDIFVKMEESVPEERDDMEYDIGKDFAIDAIVDFLKEGMDTEDDMLARINAISESMEEDHTESTTESKTESYVHESKNPGESYRHMMEVDSVDDMATSNQLPLYSCQMGRGLAHESEGEQEDEVEDLGDDDLTVDVFNFPNTFFHLELNRTKSFKHKGNEVVNEQSFTATLREHALTNPNATLGDIHNQLYLLFHSLLEEIHNVYHNNDLVRVFITHEEIVQTNIIVGPDYLGHITADLIMDHIADVIHSNNFIPADAGLSINVAAIKNIKGLRFYEICNVGQDIHGKRCLIPITNHDNLCLPRAIAVAISHAKWKADPTNIENKKMYQAMKKKEKKQSKRMSAQKRAALNYQQLAGLKWYSDGLLEHIPLYEQALQVGITVISSLNGNKTVYKPNQTFVMQLVLYHYQHEDAQVGHFAVVTSINGLISRNFYCSTCDTGFSNKTAHRCKSWCNVCGFKSCPIGMGDQKECSICYASCRSAECLVRHQKKNPKTEQSLCDRMLFCPHCKVKLNYYKKRGWHLSKHTCGEAFCNNCKVRYLPEEQDHQCYMRSIPAQKNQLYQKRFIFYDFESMLARNGEHRPNLVIAQSICDACAKVVTNRKEGTCDVCGHRCLECAQWSQDKSQFKRKPCPNTCGQTEMMFTGDDTVHNFCTWLFSKQHKGVIAVAHNARSYDSYFLYNYLIHQSIVPKIIFQGSKIMWCEVGHGLNMKLIDSLNFLNMPLSLLPKSFGLHELKKGYFPHLYNVEGLDSSKKKLSHLPDKTFYDVDNMNVKARECFLKWYNAHARDAFDFDAELIEYCRSDVDILLQACWKFRSLFMNITGPEHPIDPFDYVTIASLCMGSFRSKFLPEEWLVLFKSDARFGCTHNSWECQCSWKKARKQHGDALLEYFNESTREWTRIESSLLACSHFVKSPIALLPPHGYGRRDNFSQEAMEWLTEFEEIWNKTYPHHRIQIQHAQSPMGEKKIYYHTHSHRPRFYKLDGYFVDMHGVKHGMEFNGCWYHGCPRCYNKDRDTSMIMGKSLKQRYIETLKKISHLQSLGIKMHTIWSCDYARQRTHASSKKHISPIQFRDCYFGGRTNAIILNKEFQGSEKGGYVDFCSLYPYVLKYESFPVGHPTRITSNFPTPVWKKCTWLHGECPLLGGKSICTGWHQLLPFFGLVKLTITPPRNLLYPILPLKINGKLMFPLCHTCAARESRELCNCSDAERSMTHTWCTPEINVALNMGYEINKVHEVLHWPTQNKIQDDGTGGLFTQYINMFLCIKTQASGYPSHVQNDEDALEYVQKYEQHEKVHLNRACIQYNPGLRSIGKLALNSFYGKFGQRVNLKKVKYMTDPKHLYDIITDRTKQLKDIHVINEHMLAVEYTHSEEFQSPDTKTNVILSAFCTSYARIKLWKTMQQLGSRVLYHDTDSVLYTYQPNEWTPSTGQFLGDLTDELGCKDVGCPGCSGGHWITEFVSCGAKNYAYRLNTGQVVCKVRGFSLNYSASQVVNLNSMKEALISWKNQTDHETDLITLKTMIKRNKKQAIIYTAIMPKRYGVVYNKRVVLDNYHSIPYGF